MGKSQLAKWFRCLLDPPVIKLGHQNFLLTCSRFHDFLPKKFYLPFISFRFFCHKNHLNEFITYVTGILRKIPPTPKKYVH